MADDCLYVVRRGDDRLKILIHVDDFVGHIQLSRAPLYDDVVGVMSIANRFKITDSDGPSINADTMSASPSPSATTVPMSCDSAATLIIRRSLDSPGGSSPEATGSSAKFTELAIEVPFSLVEQQFMSEVPYRALAWTARGQFIGGRL